MNIIITNADFKHTLAAVKSLGKRGIEVTAASHNRKSLSFYSKYCRHRIIYTNPENEELFISDILDIIKKNKYDVLLPVGYIVCHAISKYQEKLLPYVKIPIVNFETMQIASDKNRTVEFAAKIGVITPKTIFPKSIEEVKAISDMIKYPVVIKIPRGIISIRYANSSQELVLSYNEIFSDHKYWIKNDELPQIQEYIPGEGYGFFALFNHGEPRAIFAHKRLHEYPPTGGSSTMAQSIFDHDLNEIGIRILKALNWHGVAMVEFKKDARDNTFKLIEINPKFWGSLDLAIASGVDFPYLSSKMCVDGDIQPVFNYKEGIIFRWIFPDLLFSIARNSLKDYIFDFLDKRIIDDLDFNDIKPATLQGYYTIFEIISRMRTNKLTYPQGKPSLSLSQKI